MTPVVRAMQLLDAAGNGLPRGSVQRPSPCASRSLAVLVGMTIGLVLAETLERERRGAPDEPDFPVLAELDVSDADLGAL